MTNKPGCNLIYLIQTRSHQIIKKAKPASWYHKYKARQNLHIACLQSTYHLIDAFPIGHRISEALTLIQNFKHCTPLKWSHARIFLWLGTSMVRPIPSKAKILAWQTCPWEEKDGPRCTQCLSWWSSWWWSWWLPVVGHLQWPGNQ